VAFAARAGSTRASTWPRTGCASSRSASIDGALFGTLADDCEPLEDYLGAPVLAQLRRLFDRPVRVLGYNRQRIRGNWKLYAENTRDNYHASLLHEFLVTFGLDRSTQIGGVKMDARHRHNITWAEADSDADIAGQAYGEARVRSNYLSLKEPELVRFRRERADPLNIAITSVFPSAVFVQISNSLAVRQIRPRGIDEVEVFQTMLGYADDSPDMPCTGCARPTSSARPGSSRWKTARRSRSRTAPRSPTATAPPLSSWAAPGPFPTATTASPTCRCAASGPITPS
jgi:phenylpropionate dioxygenase-like ring-hydroxylating dioxygenase large terminal subunit